MIICPVIFALASSIDLDIDGELVEEKLGESNDEAKYANEDKAVENLNVKMSWDIAGWVAILASKCFSRS